MKTLGRVIVAVCLFLSAALAAAAETTPARQPWHGVFEPRAQAIIPSEVAMTVTEMPRKPGERCAEGDVLVVFDSSLADAAVEAMEAKVEAEEQNHQGLRNLYERNQVTHMEVARAASDLARARFELESARREAESCRVLAPFAGKIVDQRVREFEWASKGAPLLLLVDDSLLKVCFFLPEDNYSRIKRGDRVDIWVPAASRKVTGEVSRMGVVFDPVSRTFDVWADVENDADLLRAGMTAEVTWPAGDDDR